MMRIKGRYYDTFNTIVFYGFMCPLLVYFSYLVGLSGEWQYIALVALAAIMVFWIFFTFRSIPTPFNWNR